MIYVVKADKYTKIGVTKDFDKRLRGIQNGCPFKIEVLFLMEGSFEQESKVHRQLKLYNTYGEWYQLPFEVHKELLEFLIEEYDYEKEQEFKKVKAVMGSSKCGTEKGLRGLMKGNSKKKKESIDRIAHAIKYQKQLNIFITKPSTVKATKDLDEKSKGVSIATVNRHWSVFSDDVNSYHSDMFGTDKYAERRAASIIEQLIDSYNKGNKTKMALHRDTGVSRPTIDNYWKIVTK